MKKVLYSLILTTLFLSKSVYALEPEIKLTAQDLGYNDSSSIVYFENIDDKYLGLFVAEVNNGEGQYLSVLYNLDTKESISLDYIDSSGLQYNISEYQYYDIYFTKNLTHRFHKQGNKVYNIISDKIIINDYTRKYLLVTDINTLEKSILPIDVCSDDISFISTDHHAFITELNNCNQDFTLFEFSDTTVNQVFKLYLGESKILNQIQIFAPYAFKDNIYISNLSSLYVFDANNNQVERLIDDINQSSLRNIENQIESFPTQYYNFNEEVYLVYSDMYYQSFFGSTYINKKSGNIRIWKTDGTKAGTSLENVSAVDVDALPNLYLSKLFSLNQKLYWIGESNAQNQTPIYQFKNKELYFVDFIDSLPIQENSKYTAFLGDNKSYFQLTLFNNFSSVNWKGKDWMPYYYLGQDYTDNTTSSLWVGLISIENNKLEFKVLENPIIDSNLFKQNININSSYYDFELIGMNNDDLGILIWGQIYDIDLDSIIHFVSMNVLNDLSKSPIDSFLKLSESSYYFFNNRIDDEIAFIFTDSTSNQDVLWSFNVNVPTPIKNLTFSQKYLFKLYPNPSAQYITLESLEFLKGQMMIVGMDGKVYQTLNFSGHQKNLDISQLSAGMYMTVFVGDGITSTNTFVKSE